jgi:uncharacterized protein YndB with AHSA1/START domain
VTATVRTERVVSASPQQVYAAFEQPTTLARWWGPNGFTNTFHQFEFVLGGRWRFDMHAPSGATFPNESVFRELEPARKIVLEHVVKPLFRLTVTLTAEGHQTRVGWEQEFESPEVAKSMREFVTAANEQCFDRLQALLTC